MQSSVIQGRSPSQHLDSLRQSNCYTVLRTLALDSHPLFISANSYSSWRLGLTGPSSSSLVSWASDRNGCLWVSARAWKFWPNTGSQHMVEAYIFKVPSSVVLFLATLPRFFPQSYNGEPMQGKWDRRSASSGFTSSGQAYCCGVTT